MIAVNTLDDSLMNRAKILPITGSLSNSYCRVDALLYAGMVQPYIETGMLLMMTLIWLRLWAINRWCTVALRYMVKTYGIDGRGK